MNKTTKTAQFTPGPWTVEQCSAPVYGSDGSIIAEGIGIGARSTHIGTVYGKNNAHNATLIAAAPAMYEALKGCLRVTEAWKSQAEMNGDTVEIEAAVMEIRRIKSVLAQAEGRQA